MSSEATAPQAASSSAAKRRGLRRLLILGGIAVALLIALFIYLSGGRYVSEEDTATAARTVLISPEVAGKIVSLAVKEGQDVAEGDALFTIDPTPYQIARDTAKAEIDTAIDALDALKAAYALKQSVIVQGQANEALAQATYDRTAALVGDGAETRAARDQASASLNVAKATVAQAQSDANSTLAQLGGSLDRPDNQQPSVQQAQLALDNAQRNLDLTQVKAPFAGKLINVDSVAIGTELALGSTAMALVAAREPWVVANIKESDLPGIIVGSPATVTIDAFPGITWNGKVEAIGSATADSFAILPAQNATGNWVKVVQRVPVKISLDPVENVPEISAGLSATVSIDTGRTRSLSGLFSDLAGMF